MRFLSKLLLVGGVLYLGTRIGRYLALQQTASELDAEDDADPTESIAQRQVVPDDLEELTAQRR